MLISKAMMRILQMKNPVELKNELEEGLKITASDFNL